MMKMINDPENPGQKSYPRWIFPILSISLPFLFLILIELLLRLTHAGTETKLFIKSSRLPGYLVMNPEVSRRYFASRENATRGFLEDFPEVKQDNTIRIFVQGESSAVGFPYLNNGSFHRMLKYRLDREFPDIRFEIINLGLTAICSYTLLDFAPEIVRQKPDAIIIYTGHNEYIGAMGIGATAHYNSNRRVTKLLIAFRKLRLTQVVTSLIQRICNAGEMLEGKNLMQRMAEKQHVEYGSKAYNAGIGQFRDNLTRLLALYRKEQIPVFISDLVANEKDLAPFISFSPGSAPSGDLLKLIKSSEQKILNGNTRQGIIYLRNAEALDSLHAGVQFLLGRAFYEMQQYDTARVHFLRAKDFDQLRLRAPEEINHVIASVAREQDACFIPVKAAFENLSCGGIIGNEFVTEHVHPNLPGYFLLAGAFHDSLISSPLLKNKQRLSFGENTFRSEMPLTIMDSLYGHYNVIKLKNEWPFYRKDSIVISGDDPLQSILAKQIVLTNKNWLEALDEVYVDAVRRNDHMTGLRVSEALCLEFPYDVRFMDKAARHALASELPGKAGFYFNKAFELSSSTEYAREAMIAYLKADEPEKALHYLAFLMNTKDMEVQYLKMHEMIEEIIKLRLILKNTGEQINPLIGIARNYYLMGNFGVAEIYIRDALMRDPGNKEAVSLLNDILLQIEQQ